MCFLRSSVSLCGLVRCALLSLPAPATACKSCALDALLTAVIVMTPITLMWQPLPAGYGHLVVATSTQCCIYSLSSLNTPTITDIKDTVTLLLLSERQARAALHCHCAPAQRDANRQSPQGAGCPLSQQQLRAQRGHLMQSSFAAEASF